jgi:hypothetical protein
VSAKIPVLIQSIALYLVQSKQYKSLLQLPSLPPSINWPVFVGDPATISGGQVIEGVDAIRKISSIQQDEKVCRLIYEGSTLLYYACQVVYWGYSFWKLRRDQSFDEYYADNNNQLHQIKRLHHSLLEFFLGARKTKAFITLQ